MLGDWFLLTLYSCLSMCIGLLSFCYQKPCSGRLLTFVVILGGEGKATYSKEFSYSLGSCVFS